MKNFDRVHPIIIDRWCREYRLGRNDHVIVHVEDETPIGTRLLDSYSQAVTLGFVTLVKSYNAGQDHEFKLTEEGQAFISFKVL